MKSDQALAQKKYDKEKQGKERPGKGKHEEIQLSRVQQVWLLMALAVAAIPIWFWLPIWVPILTILSLGWRASRIWKGTVKPNRPVIFIFAVAVFTSTFIDFWPPVGLEPMTALLLCASCLKYMEMRRMRDAKLLINLCYFVSGIQLIFATGMVAFLIAITSMTVALSAQNILQRSRNQQYSMLGFSLGPFLNASKLVLVSVPLMAMIFVFAPRLPSFWVVPTPQSQAKTGVSDSMRTGSISQLTRSSELAFRVSFEGAVPAKSEMYWRAIVLSRFDGETWRPLAPPDSEGLSMREIFLTDWSGADDIKGWQADLQYAGEPLAYTVYQEPSNQRWMYAIAAPTVEESNVGVTSDLRLISRLPITQRKRYRVESYPNYAFQPSGLSDRDIRSYLQLPNGYNPEARNLAESWRLQGLSAGQVVQEINQRFNREFTYTLEPGTYGRDLIDEFLFNRKRGFCEHFASSTVFLLRAAGVPARLVTGYQGGEVSPFGDYVLVHQYDAHAWAEYWQPGVGWVQIDPTAAVSPARIDQGARMALEADSEFLADSFLSLNRLQDFAVANWLRLRLDRAEYIWARWVLGYDGELQNNFFQSMFGRWDLKKLAIFLTTMAAVLLSSVWLYFYIRLPERKQPLVERRYRIFCQLCEKAGLKVSPSTTPAQLIQMAEDLPEEKKRSIYSLGKLFEKQLFADEDKSAEIALMLKRFKRGQAKV